MHVVIVAADFNAQPGYLAEVERNTRGRFSVPTDSPESRDRPNQVCFDQKLFLANTIIAVKTSSANLVHSLTLKA